jgi:hypothetical protein
MLVDVHWEYRHYLHDSTKALRISCFLTGAPFTTASLILDLISVSVDWSVVLGGAIVLRETKILWDLQ